MASRDKKRLKHASGKAEGAIVADAVGRRAPRSRARKRADRTHISSLTSTPAPPFFSRIPLEPDPFVLHPSSRPPYPPESLLSLRKTLVPLLLSLEPFPLPVRGAGAKKTRARLPQSNSDSAGASPVREEPATCLDRRFARNSNAFQETSGGPVRAASRSSRPPLLRDVGARVIIRP